MNFDLELLLEMLGPILVYTNHFCHFQFDYEILGKFNKRKIAREQQQENDGQTANGNHN